MKEADFENAPERFYHVRTYVYLYEGSKPFNAYEIRKYKEDITGEEEEFLPEYDYAPIKHHAYLGE